MHRTFGLVRGRGALGAPAAPPCVKITRRPGFPFPRRSSAIQRDYVGHSCQLVAAIVDPTAPSLPPKTPAELRPQFHALCRAVGLDPAAPDALVKLSDPSVVPASAITHAIETDATGPEYGTFRGSLDGDWLATSPGPMEWQRSGAFAHALKRKGVRSVVVGDLTEEWYLYSIAHGAVHSTAEVRANLERYYPADFVDGALPLFRTVPEGAPVKDFMRLFGEVSSTAQVHCPVRILARDLTNAGFPVLRYEIAWTPEQVRPEGSRSCHRYATSAAVLMYCAL